MDFANTEGVSNVQEAPAAGAAARQELRAYSVGPPTGSGRRLHLNEYRYAHDAGVVDAVRQVCAEAPAATLLAEYPAGPSDELLRQLAAYVGAPGPANVAAAAGSDEALRAVVETCGLRGQATVVVGVPTYTHFLHFVRLRGLRLREYAVGLATTPEAHASLLECYAAELAEGALVYLGNPNNPTGDLWAPSVVAEFAARYPRSTFLADEAYTEFAGAAASEAEGETGDADPRQILNRRSLAPLAAATPNLIVTRTFSKAFGLAGLRVGYAVAAPATISQLNLVLSPKAFGQLAEAGALAALQALPHYLETTRRALAATKALVQELKVRGWWVATPCVATANFYLLYAHDADLVVRELERCGIFIRNRTDLPGLAGFVRISAGSARDSDAVLAAFQKLAPPAVPAIQRFYTPKDKIAALRHLLRKTRAVLRDAGMVTWLYAGTLLGAIRHGGIIPWDDDIDLGYAIEDSEAEDPMRALADSFRMEGLALQRNRTDAYWQVGTNSVGERISTTHIDIFPFISRSAVSVETGRVEKEYVVADERFQEEAPDCPNAHCNMRFGDRELYPLRELAFYGERMLAPARAEDVLARALGPEYPTVAHIRADQPGRETMMYTIQDFFPA